MTEITKIKTGSMPHGSRISKDGLKQYSVAMMSGELFEIDALSSKRFKETRSRKPFVNGSQ